MSNEQLTFITSDGYTLFYLGNIQSWVDHLDHTKRDMTFQSDNDGQPIDDDGNPLEGTFVVNDEDQKTRMQWYFRMINEAADTVVPRVRHVVNTPKETTMRDFTRINLLMTQPTCDKWNEIVEYKEQQDLPPGRDTITQLTLRVNDNISMTLQLVNSVKPYIQAVWFDGGHEISCEIIDKLAPGLVIRCEHEDTEYEITITED